MKPKKKYFKSRCSNKACKIKLILRYFSFLKLHNKIPASIIIFILENFILIKANEKQIQKMIELKYKFNIGYITVLNILKM